MNYTANISHIIFYVNQVMQEKSSLYAHVGIIEKWNLAAKVLHWLNKLSHVLDWESCPLNGIPLCHTIKMPDPFKLNKLERMKDGKASLVYSQEFRLNLFNGFWFEFYYEGDLFISSLDTHQGCFLFVYAWSHLLEIRTPNTWTLQDRRVILCNTS